MTYEKDRAQLDESGHKLFEPGKLVGLNGTDCDPEFLAARPPHDRTIDKHGRMLSGKEHTEGDDHTGLDWM